MEGFVDLKFRKSALHLTQGPEENNSRQKNRWLDMRRGLLSSEDTRSNEGISAETSTRPTDQPRPSCAKASINIAQWGVKWCEVQQEAARRRRVALVQKTPGSLGRSKKSSVTPSSRRRVSSSLRICCSPFLSHLCLRLTRSQSHGFAIGD